MMFGSQNGLQGVSHVLPDGSFDEDLAHFLREGSRASVGEGGLFLGHRPRGRHLLGGAMGTHKLHF